MQLNNKDPGDPVGRSDTKLLFSNKNTNSLFYWQFLMYLYINQNLKRYIFWVIKL